MKNVLVYGFYGKNNIGDNLFIQAFKNIFPELNFIFCNNISSSNLKNISYVFFGGGSFVYDKPSIDPDCIGLLKEKKIFYIGIGIEGEIHLIHQELMKVSKLIALRSVSKLSYTCTLNKNVIIIPDIVYSLYSSNFSKKEKSVLVLPNIVVVPHNKDPQWKHIAWQYFKSEFCQFLDDISINYNINFLSMCNNNTTNDMGACFDIINNMEKRRYNSIITPKNDEINNLISLFSKYEVIISQRYHGSILAQLAKTPYITISHHDKLKMASGANISYYNTNKDKLFNNFNDVKDKSMHCEHNINSFIELQQFVRKEISED